MKIRDLHAQLSDDKTEHTMPSGGLEIIADDGRTLFSIRIQNGASISISAGCSAKHGGKILDNSLTIKPEAANLVTIERQEYK